MALFSCIELTTFSRSMGVMCLRWARLSVESVRRNPERDDDELERLAEIMALSICDSSEATLEDSSGIAVSLFDRRRSNVQRGGIIWSGAQQNVSRPHSRQAMFSRRLPSSIAREHFEKTDQRPNRFSGFLVSMVCIDPGSTRTMGYFERRGMSTEECAVVVGGQRPFAWACWGRGAAFVDNGGPEVAIASTDRLQPQQALGARSTEPGDGRHRYMGRRWDSRARGR